MHSTAGLSIAGTLHAFLLLAARCEDSDTLFFQQQLRIEGDMELGLDVDALWLSRQVSSLAQKALPLYERTFS